MGVSLISLLIVFNPIWEFKIKGIVLLAAFCKRKGIWYGVVIMANPVAALLSVTFVSLILLLLLDLSLVSMSHLVAKWNHVPAQPPTPFIETTRVTLWVHGGGFILIDGGDKIKDWTNAVFAHEPMWASCIGKVASPA